MCSSICDIKTLYLASLVFITYRLDAEAKGSTVFRIPEDVYKTRGR